MAWVGRVKTPPDLQSLNRLTRPLAAPSVAKRFAVSRARSTNPQQVGISVSLGHQLTRWSTSSSGAGCAARSQCAAICAPSSVCASLSSHNGGPRACHVRGGFRSNPMWYGPS